MALLTSNFVERECLRTLSQKCLSKKMSANHLGRLTHLIMTEKFITAIGDISICKNLKVIHLQNNNITKIQNLDFATEVTHLYLQHNELTKIENLENLGKLTELNLGHNCISVVEGLHKLENLRKLHIERQRLLSGDYLLFEPRTVDTLSIRLTELNVTGNRLTSLRAISGITSLEILEAKDNLIEDIEDLTESVVNLRELSVLSLQGNPVTRTYRYRENLIANSRSLKNLDGKRITEVCREFMRKFKENQLLRKQRRSKMTLSDDITSSLKLPPAFERSVSRAIIQTYPGPKFTFNVTSASADSQPQIFPAWKSAAAVAGTKSNERIAPRPFWRILPSTKQCLRKTKEIDGKVFPNL